MNSLEKYNSIRHELKDGDIILCYSTKPIAKAIQKIDKAYYHHSGIIFKSNGRVFVMDSHPGKGTHPGYLSHRIRQQKWEDFMVLRPKETKKRVQQALELTFMKANEFLPYDFSMLLKILIHKSIGVWNGEAKNDKFICSQFTQYYGIHLGIEEYFPQNLKLPYFTPQDHLRIKTNALKIVVE